MQSTAIRVVTGKSLARRPAYCARRDLLVALGLNNLFAAVKTGWADVMSAVNLARGRLDRRRRIR
jgi:hypothetical protein